ncbi:carboxypeptidase-like regulatory domain-containing protein [Gemmatimonadota bacterium]
MNRQKVPEVTRPQRMQLRGMLVLSISILLLPTSAFSQETTGSFRGKIADKESGKPIVAANIIVHEKDGTPTRLGAFSGEYGEYLIRGVAPGTYTLHAVMMGYMAIDITDLTVTAGVTTRQDIQLEMRTPAVITGKVMDKATGEPLKGVKIQVLVGSFDIGYTVLTNEKGEYRIEKFPSGRYTIQVSLEGYGTVNQEDFRVEEGAEVKADFQLEKSGG